MKMNISIIALISLLSISYGQEFSTEKMSFLGLEAISINSIGHFEEDWVSGSGGYVGLENLYSNNWAVIFQTGFIEFKQNTAIAYISDPSFTMIPLRIGGQFYIVKGFISPYLSATGGANIITRKIETADKKLDETSISTHFQVGAGIALNFYQSWRINFAARYNSHLLEPGVPYNITGLEFSVGINLGLGK